MAILIGVPSQSYASDTFPGTTISGTGSLTASNASATAQTGEPTPDGNAAFQPLNTMWYSWTAPSNGVLVVQTCGSTATSFDTVLGLFTGTAVNALTQLAANDDTTNCSVSTNVSYGSSITQTVTSGTTYRVQVDGYGSATGTFNLQYLFTSSQPVMVTTADATATEGGDTASFSIRLGSAPTANVTITIAPDPATPDQCTFSATTLTFTTANWATAQSVTATAVNDTTVEGTHTCTTGTITASGGGFTGQSGTAPTFTITDNDTQAVSVLNTDDTAAEGGLGGSFTVRLLSAPTANVTVAIGADPATPDQCTFSAASLTFTTANWATAQTVTVTAVNDTTPEGVHSCTTGTIIANGGGYVNVSGTAPTFTITDNDQGILVTNTDSATTEGGDTGAFTVVLATLPTATVTVTIAADSSGQCTFAPTSLTFTTSNWNTAQTVTTTAVNDAVVEGSHSCNTGTITSAGGDYAGLSATAQSFTITDNDTGTITVATTTATATEGGSTGAFTVVLGLQPSASVTVTIAADASGQCTFAPTTLTFTTANWNTAQTVTTTAVNDVIVEGTHSCSTGAISASGGGYTGVTGTAPTFTITDNDTGTITVATTTATATEGGSTGAFTVVLGLQPSASVTVTIAADASGQCTFAPTTLTFTTANWNTAQTVTTTAVNDVIVEGTHSCSTGAISASGGGYTGVTGTAPTFTITDNDTGTITVATTTATATEGGSTGAFTVVLGLQPSTSVTVTIAADSSGQCTFAPTTLTFTTANWNTAQTVTTTAVNDVVVEGTHSCSTGAISASGGGYTGVTGTAPTFTITDNDTGAITIVKTIGTATEGGATGAFTVVLTAQPATSVTVTIGVDGTGQCTFAPTPLTFTTANWNTAQTVTTTAVNDLLVEGAHSCTTGSISASGSGYTGVTGTSQTFTITDNDTGAITIVKTVGIATEGGSPGAFTVVLTAQPATNVTVTIGVDGAGQCTFAPTPLTFTTANWSTAQTVTTTAVNDLLVEGAHSCTTGSISASGSGYTGVTGTSQTFTITDNDTASITLTKNASVSSVGHAGDTVSYTIQVSNTGNVAATAITVSDTLVSVTCPTSGTNAIATLAPSASETCTASYTATQADFDTNGGGDGDIDNSASASGTSGGVPVAASDSKAVLCTPSPSLTLLKSANKAGPLIAGETVTYTFLATNTGNVTLSNVSIDETAFNGTSPPLGTPTGETLTDNAPLNTLTEKSDDSVANNGVWTTLKPNDSVTFTINYTVTQDDVDALQ